MPCAFPRLSSANYCLHAAKYRVIGHNLGSITVFHNFTYVTSLRLLAVMFIFKEMIIQVNE